MAFHAILFTDVITDGLQTLKIIGYQQHVHFTGGAFVGQGAANAFTSSCDQRVVQSIAIKK